VNKSKPTIKMANEGVVKVGSFAPFWLISAPFALGFFFLAAYRRCKICYNKLFIKKGIS